MKTVFLRVLDADDKDAALRAVIRGHEAAEGVHRFEVDPQNFATVPGSPFAYWVRERVLRLFKDLPGFESEDRTAKQGLTTADDFRFARLWWEVSSAAVSRVWFPFAKGGAFSRYYGDTHLMVNWSEGGREVYEFNGIPYGTAGAPLRNPAYYFRPGLTWPHRGAVFSAAALPGGSVFSSSGKAAFVPFEALLPMLALFNSTTTTLLLRIQSDAVRIKFECGLVSRLPIAEVGADDARALGVLARRAWSLNQRLDTRRATSHAFTLPALLQIEGRAIDIRAAAWAAHVHAIEADLHAIQSEIDDHCSELYGIGEADLLLIAKGVWSVADGSFESDEATVDTDEDSEMESGDAGTLAAELVSWAAGVAFGRFDVRLATGERAMPAEPGPFDPLPVCSPGMLAGEDGLPLGVAPSGYPLTFPASGVLVDDPGDPRDLGAALQSVFETVFGASAEACWQEAAAVLDPRGHDLRAWLGSGLFEHHLKLHSKSRRKAPILWQLGVPSGRYSVWLYAHRLTGDSFFQLQSEVVAPKLAYEERRLTGLVQSSEGTPSAKERREIATQEAFVEELRALLEEVKRVAPLWKPTLDDGVVLVMAPLWRLVVHKTWQRELKAKWAELVAGKYDWAQLAMHLWPERVVPKCATDRSLAIAHGLEDAFWIQDDGGKWEARKVAPADTDRLIAVKASHAIKDALESLVTASAPAARGGKREASV
jgi:hypothetical protein